MAAFTCLKTTSSTADFEEAFPFFARYIAQKKYLLRDTKKVKQHVQGRYTTQRTQ